MSEQPSLADLIARLDALLGRASAAERRFLSVTDAGAYSGMSPKSIRRLLSAGKLTSLRPVRGRVLIDRQEIDSLILGSRKTIRGGRGKR